MEITLLNDRLNNEFNKYYNCILVDGKWGIGKTYYIKEYLSKRAAIYISLFGINSCKEIKESIYQELIHTYDKIYRMTKTYFDCSTITTSYLILPSFKKELENILKEELKNNKLIVVLDDLERKNNQISFKEILGIVEALSSISNIKVILIANTSEIDEKEKEIFNNFREKVIDKSYVIDKYSSKALEDISKAILNKICINPIIDENNYLSCLNDFLIKHNIKNLRTVSKMIKFSGIILNNINLDCIPKNDIRTIIIASFAIIEETIESNIDLIKTVSKTYLQDVFYPLPKEDLITYILNIYNEKDIEINFQNINDFYNLINNFKNEKDNKDLFFCSEEQIEKRINKFVKSSINKHNNKLSLDEWYNELYGIYYYAELINRTYLLRDDDVIRIMDQYVEKIDCKNTILFNLIYKMQHNTNKTDKILILYKILKDKIVYKYFLYNYELAASCLKTNNLDNKVIANLITFILSDDFKNTIDCDRAIAKLKVSNLFIPSLDGDIDEKIWNWVHEIWKGIASGNATSPNRRKLVNLLLQISNDKYQTATTIGKYRIESLNKYYNVIDV